MMTADLAKLSEILCEMKIRLKIFWCGARFMEASTGSTGKKLNK